MTVTVVGVPRRQRRAHPELLPQRLKTLRAERGYTAKRVYTQAGISRQYYWELEHRVVAAPSADVIERLAEVLATSSGYLLGGTQAGGLPVGEAPAELRQAQVRLHLSNDEARLLNTIRWNNRRPSSVEDWVFLAQAIRFACGDHAH